MRLLKSSLSISKNMYLNSKIVLNVALSEKITQLLFGDQKINESRLQARRLFWPCVWNVHAGPSHQLWCKFFHS